MEWTGDVAAGDWIRAQVDDPWRGTMHDVVPRGFAAYARVLHPASRSRPVGREWPPLPFLEHEAEWAALYGTEIDEEPTTWAQAAASFGTTLHPLAQWGALVRGGDDRNGAAQAISTDGWQYDAPEEGRLDATVLSILAEHLASATTTPNDGGIAIWEGWGDLVGHLGHRTNRSVFGWVDGEPFTVEGGQVRASDAPGGHASMLAASVRDRFNDVFRKPTWRRGVLSDEISRGPRFALPNRNHVLFRGGIADLVAPNAVTPWSAHSLPLSPSLAWPADRAWALVTEVDFDSTVIGGRAELIAALVADARLEAFAIPADADLSWAADRINA